jgi:hypothetical protein
VVWIGSRNKLIRKDQKRKTENHRKKKPESTEWTKEDLDIGTSGEIRRAASSTVNLDR